MGWNEVIGDLERKLVGTLKGTFLPMDGVPVFRVQYPPSEEREALRQFRLLAERLKQKGYQTVWIPMKDALKQALASLIGCDLNELDKRVRALEEERDRKELRSLLSEYLPNEIVRAIVSLLEQQCDRSNEKGVAFLVRTSVLFPFLRPSTLLSRLEGKTKWIIVFAYPGVNLGAFLDAQPADLHGGYYRGEIIRWQ